MQQQSKIFISEKLGEVSAIAMVPDGSSYMLVLAHGAGAGMTHQFMESLAQQLYDAGVATLRYNLHYMENGKKRPDPPAIAHQTIERVAKYAHEKYPHHHIILSGKSFGGRMSSQKVAKEDPGFIHGLIFYGFPLHPIGKEGTERADHLKEVKVPMLFLQGTKDKLATQELIEQVVNEHSRADLVMFEGADHSFKIKKEVIIPQLVDATSQWLQKL